ncbi:hypothetical protein ACFS7Z_07005 [Pontibacter toksunensis]|uniref:Uncharacterized protein n=1 Tax=Pontibacter toksunensis TaxID=1332631 RepID=A0ABW6BT33_9BACT
MSRVILKVAENLAHAAVRIQYSNTDFRLDLNSKLSHYYSPADKLMFLNHLITLVQKRYDEHHPNCSNPEKCHTDIMCEKVLYFANQEIEQVKKLTENEGVQRVFGTYIGSLSINGSNSVLNFGEIRDSIITNTQQLESEGATNVSASILELSKAIEEAVEIEYHDKNEYLDNLKFLSEQALIAKEERVNLSVIKRLLKGMFDGLSAVSSVSTIAGMTLKDISDYFLIAN